MIEQQSAGIITFIQKDHEILYLLLHYLSGHWDFAKGKLESGETMIEAAQRELMEETGLHAKLLPGFEKSLKYIFKERGKLIEKTVTFFVGHTDKQTIQLSREHVGYLWLPYEQAHQKLTYKNAQEILAQAHQFITKETLLKKG